MNKSESLPVNEGNHFHRYIEYAHSVLTKYSGGEPFHLYLKKYFSANKKHGSRDRKEITSLCFRYFRLGMAVSPSVDINERILLATFLVEKDPSPLLQLLKSQWNEKIHFNISGKLEVVKNIFDAEKIFPFREELSDSVDFQRFNLSFLTQPKLFIRTRPGYNDTIISKLKSANISFEAINADCLSFSNNEKVSDVIKIDEEAVIQDYNSQRTGEFLQSEIANCQAALAGSSKTKIWDCCAASGGKSILAYDVLKNIELTVSDTRKNILENLRKRFAKAGIKNYHSFVADLSSSPLREGSVPGPGYDLIIADVPCTGSGTWARTPEQLHFFSKNSIKKYALLQRKIVQNASNFLNPGGHFLYITCSVFKKENEENVAFIQKELPFELLESRYLKGYEMQADTLFAALFKNASLPSKGGF